jgi:hypothetical protein
MGLIAAGEPAGGEGEEEAAGPDEDDALLDVSDADFCDDTMHKHAVSSP